jgi:putative colanic acid biosynthesis UDP-glucose lipid carrier transferase
MVNTGHAHREFRYILLHALRRISGAIVAVLALRDPYLALAVIVALICLLLLPDKSPNERVLPPRISSTTLSVIGRWFLIVGILLLLGYATKTSQIFSRKVLFTWFMMTPPLLIVVQVCIDVVLSSMALSAGNTRRVVIAGQNELGHKLASKLLSTPTLGMRVDGFFDDRGVERLAQGSSAPLLGKLNELPDFVREHGTDLIFIVLPMRNIQRVTDLLGST